VSDVRFEKDLQKICKRFSGFKLVFMLNKNFGNSIDNKEVIE
jgi:hypothetical protein